MIDINNPPDNIKLDIIGKNHKIEIHEFTGEGTLSIKLRGDGCHIVFDKNNMIEKGTLCIIGNNYPNKTCEGSCYIGTGNKFRGNLNLFIPLQKDKSIHIGNDNLFAGGSEIVGCMEHVVFDKESGEILNKETGVEIGNHNWISRNVLFMNKSGICNDSVVGIRSIVTKKITESNVVIAGCPAKVRKSGIDWKEEQ